jgi:hypothetical protein
MISLEDCVALCGLTEAEVLAVAEHEHLPEIAASAVAQYLAKQEHGMEKIREMIVDDIREAQQRQDKAHILTLLHVLHHFLKSHPDRARKVLLALQVLPRTPSEFYASTARPQRAEGSATRTTYLWSGIAVRAEFLWSLSTKEQKRDGYTSGERTRIYQLISELASHASYLGISVMTTTGPDNMAQVGPFFDHEKLASWLGEMALRLSIAAMHMPNPSGRDINLAMTQAHYLEVCQKWWWKYRGVKPQAAP